MFRTRRVRLGLVGLAAGLGALALGLSGGARLSAQPSGTSGIDTVLREAVARGDVPGIVAMAVDRRGVTYRGAFGLAEGHPARPMTTDAIFRIASMTKPLTSAAAMQLVEQSRIGLDDPVAKYLPEFAHLSVLTSFDQATGAYTVKPAARTPTVRHLLTHTSGLGYNFTSPIVRDFKPRAGDRFPVGPLLFEPGEQWLYSTATDWLGRLVEAVTGETLEAYFERRLLAPLGMVDTHFNVPEAKQARLVNVWQRDPEGRLAEQPRQAPARVTQFSGGGGLSSTAGDYARFLQMLLNDGAAGSDHAVRILSAESLAAMSRNQIGAVSARAVATAMPLRSRDFTFIHDGRDKWGLGFLITTDAVPGGRAAGSLSWGGIDNTYFWVDRSRGVAGVILMQFLPFADPKALAVYNAFERAVYAGH